MKRNKLRVIQISGFRGLLSAMFIAACLIAGFVGFPALLLSKIWNNLADTLGTIPYINLFQGLILWGILAISYIIINKKKKYLVAFEPQSANRQEIKNIINEIKAQSVALNELKDIEKSTRQDINVTNDKKTKENNEEKSKEVV